MSSLNDTIIGLSLQYSLLNAAFCTVSPMAKTLVTELDRVEASEKQMSQLSFRYAPTRSFVFAERRDTASSSTLEKFALYQSFVTAEYVFCEGEASAAAAESAVAQSAVVVLFISSVPFCGESG